jgi:glycosyltransferase involved in cell wall biosynthesis
VHLNGYAHAALPWHAPVCVVAHSCVLSWWRAVHGESAPLTWARYRAAVGAGLAAADSVIAPTEAMLYALGREYGTVRHASVVHNGRRADAFPQAVKEPFILTAGRLWDEAKNVAAVEAVATSLAWPVYLAGPTEAPSAEGRMPSTLCSLGVLPTRELARWMGRASIYTLPARYEPFGLSVLEAALAGCSLVLGDIPSLRELWDGAARFVEPDDHDALADALRALIDDPALRAHTARECRERALRYTVDSMTNGYLSAYDMLLNGTHEGPRRLACAS